MNRGPRLLDASAKNWRIDNSDDAARINVGRLSHVILKFEKLHRALPLGFCGLDQLPIAAARRPPMKRTLCPVIKSLTLVGRVRIASEHLARRLSALIADPINPVHRIRH